MALPDVRRMFSGFRFQKTVDEILEAVTKRMAQVESKIEERKARVQRIRDEFGITDQDMIQLLQQQARQSIQNARVRTQTMTYALGSGDEGETKTVGAGVVQNLLTEQDLIEQDQNSLARLSLIKRNLKPLMLRDEAGPYIQELVMLSYDELEYLGF